MFISLIIGLLASVALTPIWVQHLYNAELNIQLTQVTLDNTAIRWGRNVRSLLGMISASEKRLNHLHSLYHAALTCSVVPVTAAKCLTTSQKVRAAIQTNSLTTVHRAKDRWKKAHSEAQAQLIGSPQKLILEANPSLDLTGEPCSKCQLTRSWKMNLSQLMAHLSNEQEPKLQVRVQYEEKQKGNWNYRLSAY